MTQGTVTGLSRLQKQIHFHLHTYKQFSFQQKHKHTKQPQAPAHWATVLLSQLARTVSTLNKTLTFYQQQPLRHCYLASELGAHCVIQTRRILQGNHQMSTDLVQYKLYAGHGAAFPPGPSGANANKQTALASTWRAAMCKCRLSLRVSFTFSSENIGGPLISRISLHDGPCEEGRCWCWPQWNW